MLKLGGGEINYQETGDGPAIFYRVPSVRPRHGAAYRSTPIAL